MTVKLKGEEDLRNMTFAEKVKFYVSLCLGTTALLSVFAFLFLIPFVVDPSITTLLANFDATPVACATVGHVYAEGLSNCSWASCREGCTSATPRCHQLHVNYSQMPYDRYIRENLKSTDIKWSAGPVKFFVNTEGCGYPPKINCTEFAKQYGRDRDKEIFPCYYSRRYPLDRSVAQFDWNDTLKNLVLAIGVPNLLFGLSVGILSYWYCWPSSSEDCRPNVLSTTTYATFDSEDAASVGASLLASSRIEAHKEQKDRNPKRRIAYAQDGDDRERNALLNDRQSGRDKKRQVNYDDDDDDDDDDSDCEDLKRRLSTTSTTITATIGKNKRYRLL